ncbi:DNA cytosine methyltransferase [Agrobacterium cavarae]|uniref:Cytosine-specific methyltransferase n=1 Tax=Agrobacterium cavarae TaxID=2528239 RepID=A0ABY1YDL6_9HYPH|nr:DNA cytosine methyltransferase [Agrobacterium cavarae]TBN17030.1 DNA cytosine methyltransferase [Agrobacterium cavarae]
MLDLKKGRVAPLTFIDLFAGAGGLSEGFVQAGFEPIAHVEADLAASFTLRTREAYYRLKSAGLSSQYDEYLSGRLSRTELYKISQVPTRVINATIGQETLDQIFRQVDYLIGDCKPDLIVGGPPCQAYSLVGRARSELKMVGDKRNYLFLYYAEFLKRYKPKYFVFENVVGLLSAKEKEGRRYLDMMLSLFKDAGYSVEWKVLSAEKFGVPQKRKRIILVGKFGAESGFFPEIAEVDANFFVRDAIGDLPPIRAGEGTPYVTTVSAQPSPWLRQSGILASNNKVTWHAARPHNERDLSIFKEVVNRWVKLKERLSYDELPEKLKNHKNRTSFTDRFKVVAPDVSFSHTIVAHIAKDGNYYIHPDLTQNRSLTPREVARLQTFPDDYFFESASGQPSRTAAFKQIGNAVPVVLARRIAESIRRNWK